MNRILHASLASLLFGSFFLHAADVIEKPLTESSTQTSINIKPQRNIDFFTSLTESKKIISPKSYLEQGYLIESGRFVNKKNQDINFSIVTSPKNEITAIVGSPDETDIITVSANGIKNLIKGEKDNFLHVNDFVVESLPSPAPHLDIAEIEFLAAYSMKALTNLNVDPIAYALAQLDTASQALTNSEIPGIKLVLGGVLILNTDDADYGVSSAGLSRWQAIMNPYRTLYKTDLNMAIATGGDYAGIAYVGGYTSANSWKYPNAFRHELGHNVGGWHCWPDGGENYKHGYNNGRSKTILCGNSTPYYSNLNVVDNYGLPLGNAAQADMARLWQGQASRMAGYNIPHEGYKFIFTSVKQRESKTFAIDLPTLSTVPNGAFVALTSDVGPTSLQALPSGGYTTLNVPLRDMQNVNHNVVFRAERQIDTCPWGPMNRNVGCNTPIRKLLLRLTYEPSDNTSLPAGTYNGLLQLRAKEANDASFNPLINLPLSIVK